MRLSAKGLDELVEQTVVGIEKSKDEVAHDDPRKEVREEHHRLIDLRFALGIQLVDHQRQRYGNDDAQDDKNDIIAKRVAQKHGKRVVVDEELEILKPDEFAVNQVVKEALPRENLVLLEGNQNAEHRQITEEHIPDKRRKTQQAELHVFSRPFFLFARLRALRRRKLGTPLHGPSSLLTKLTMFICMLSCRASYVNSYVDFKWNFFIQIICATCFVNNINFVVDFFT